MWCGHLRKWIEKLREQLDSRILQHGSLVKLFWSSTFFCKSLQRSGARTAKLDFESFQGSACHRLELSQNQTSPSAVASGPIAQDSCHGPATRKHWNTLKNIANIRLWRTMTYDRICLLNILEHLKTWSLQSLQHRAKAETFAILKEVGQGSSKRTALSPKQHPCTSLQGL